MQACGKNNTVINNEKKQSSVSIIGSALKQIENDTKNKAWKVPDAEEQSHSFPLA